jgi:hypothetical protein
MIQTTNQMLVFLAIIFSFHSQQTHELHTSGATGGAGAAGGDGRVCKGLEYGYGPISLVQKYLP